MAASQRSSFDFGTLLDRTVTVLRCALCRQASEQKRASLRLRLSLSDPLTVKCTPHSAQALTAVHLAFFGTFLRKRRSFSLNCLKPASARMRTTARFDIRNSSSSSAIACGRCGLGYPRAFIMPVRPTYWCTSSSHSSGDNSRGRPAPGLRPPRGMASPPCRNRDHAVVRSGAVVSPRAHQLPATIKEVGALIGALHLVADGMS
jgi:hypothetical protein